MSVKNKQCRELYVWDEICQKDGAILVSVDAGQRERKEKQGQEKN